MTTNSLRALHQYSFLKRFSASDPNAPPPSSLFVKPPTTTTTTTATNGGNILSSSTTATNGGNILSSSTTTTTYALSSATNSSTSSATPTTSQPVSFDTLQEHLSNQNFRQADEETRRLLIVLAGEAAQKRGYVFFSEVQFISEADLKTIDELWKQYSDNKFGYSVQKRMWKKVNKDFTRFFLKVGWMKKLDTEVEQYNYRAFPNEFVWELNDETPEGHLPLTNALRGTQPLNSILSHPAFESQEEEEELKEGEAGSGKSLRDGPKSLSNRFLKPDYSF